MIFLHWLWLRPWARVTCYQPDWSLATRVQWCWHFFRKWKKFTGICVKNRNYIYTICLFRICWHKCWNTAPKIYFPKKCRKGEFYSALFFNYFSGFKISVNIFYSHMRKIIYKFCGHWVWIMYFLKLKMPKMRRKWINILKNILLFV
jgi:hypothetical protein